MQLLQAKVFVVLQVTRGRSTVVAVFNEADHAAKFITKTKASFPGTYLFQESTLYDFAPSEMEVV